MLVIWVDLHKSLTQMQTKLMQPLLRQELLHLWQKIKENSLTIWKYKSMPSKIKTKYYKEKLNPLFQGRSYYKMKWNKWKRISKKRDKYLFKNRIMTIDL